MLFPLSPTTSELALCCYVNATANIEIARITNVPNYHLERVVFPGQRLIFKAPLKAKLEIHTGTVITSILSEMIDCTKLQLTTSFPVNLTTSC